MRFSFMKKLIIFFFAVLCFLIPLFSNKASANSGAVLKVDPPTASVKAGEVFQVNIVLDTGGKSIVAAAAYIYYNPSIFRVVGASIENSCFSSFSEARTPCSYWGGPCVVVKGNNHSGFVKIIGGAPLPGARPRQCILAQLEVVALRGVEPTTDNFVFGFKEKKPGRQSSIVVLGDGLGTNVLASVQNARFQVEPSDFDEDEISWDDEEDYDWGTDEDDDGGAWQMEDEEDEEDEENYDQGSNGGQTSEEKENGNGGEQEGEGKGSGEEEGKKQTEENRLKVLGLKAINITSNSAEIVWETDRPAKGKVIYLDADAYDEVKEKEGKGYYTKKHSVLLSDLLPHRLYYFFVQNESTDGSWEVSRQMSFETATAGKSSSAGSGGGAEVKEEKQKRGSSFTEESEKEERSKKQKERKEAESRLERERIERIRELKEKIQEIIRKINLFRAELARLLKKKTAPTPKQRSKEEDYTIPKGFKFTNNLHFGQKGREIKYLQAFLSRQGKEIYPEGIVTGYFGPATKRAVIRFQEKYAEDILAPWGLQKGTGTVGRTTRIKINRLLQQ